jgi:hypothetical protein
MVEPAQPRAVREIPMRRSAMIAIVVLGTGLAAAGGRLLADPGTPGIAPLPERLSATGLHEEGSLRLRADLQAFSPQYPLWSDAASKRRWLLLPPGTAIDAADPDAWEFPPGTRLWKEFSHGAAVETRFIERLADGSWRFATYLWNADGSEAMLVPEAGIEVDVAGAPRGRYRLPSRDDCRACHAGAATPVLGVGALQLSADRDPLAPHAEPRQAGDADLRALVDRGWLVNLPPALLATPPRIAARTATERAALGYLHGNCAHCHHRSGGGIDNAVPLDLTLAQSVAPVADGAGQVRRSMLAAPARFRPPGHGDQAELVVPGDAAASVLFHRLRSRNPMVQMPPLGTRVRDEQALALLQRWIDHELPLLEDHP